MLVIICFKCNWKHWLILLNEIYRYDQIYTHHCCCVIQLSELCSTDWHWYKSTQSKCRTGCLQYKQGAVDSTYGLVKQKCNYSFQGYDCFWYVNWMPMAAQRSSMGKFVTCFQYTWLIGLLEWKQLERTGSGPIGTIPLCSKWNRSACLERN